MNAKDPFHKEKPPCNSYNIREVLVAIAIEIRIFTSLKKTMTDQELFANWLLLIAVDCSKISAPWSARKLNELDGQFDQTSAEFFIVKL